MLVFTTGDEGCDTDAWAIDSRAKKTPKSQIKSNGLVEASSSWTLNFESPWNARNRSQRAIHDGHFILTLGQLMAQVLMAVFNLISRHQATLQSFPATHLVGCQFT